MENKEYIQLVIDFQTTFKTGSGQNVLKRLRSLTTMDRSSVTDKTNINVNQLIWDEAQRFMVLYIEKMINCNLDKDKQIETVNERKENG